LPTNYYEPTTPYANFQGSKYKKYTIDNDDLIRFDEKDNSSDENDFEIKQAIFSCVKTRRSR
jgi:hypothetical protein